MLLIDDLYEDLEYMDSSLNEFIKARTPTPLDILIDKENKRDLIDSLSKLSHHELIVVLMINYENSGLYPNALVRDFFKKEKGLDLSRHTVEKLEKIGLTKLRRDLKFNRGWGM